MSKERTIYFDYLRVIAALAVIILHVCGQNWYLDDVGGFQWQTFNAFESLVRWAVPAYVMISGALFLGREISLKTLYSKYILRLVIAYIVWTVIYALFADGGVKDKFWQLICGHYHMWFLLMMIGLYICIPFFRLIVSSRQWIRYFLASAVFFAFLIPEVINLVRDFGSEPMVRGINMISDNVDKMYLPLVLCCFPAYYVLGYYAATTEQSKKQRVAIYLLGILGVAATAVLDLTVALKNGFPCEHYYFEGTLNVLCVSLAVFIWFKHRKLRRPKLNRFVQKLSKYSFGAYLVHALVIEQFTNKIGLHSVAFHPVLAVLCTAVVVYLISFAVSALLNQIPIVKKYLV